MSERDFRFEGLHQQPQNSDAVMGNQTSIANGSVVLGGIEGVKTRLNSENVRVIILALKDAIN